MLDDPDIAAACKRTAYSTRHRRIANGGSCASAKILDVGEVRKAPVTVLNAALWIVSNVRFPVLQALS